MFGYEYDQWKTMSDIDEEQESKYSETEEDLELFMEVTANDGEMVRGYEIISVKYILSMIKVI